MLLEKRSALDIVLLVFDQGCPTDSDGSCEWCGVLSGRKHKADCPWLDIERIAEEHQR